MKNYKEMVKTKLKMKKPKYQQKNVKRLYLSILTKIQNFYRRQDNTIHQYIHQVASVYIVVSQQKWNNTYVQTLYKLEGGLQTFIIKMKS